jgi:hypothetical protein
MLAAMAGMATVTAAVGAMATAMVTAAVPVMVKAMAAIAIVTRQ